MKAVGHALGTTRVYAPITIKSPSIHEAPAAA